MIPGHATNESSNNVEIEQRSNKYNNQQHYWNFPVKFSATSDRIFWDFFLPFSIVSFNNKWNRTYH